MNNFLTLAIGVILNFKYVLAGINVGLTKGKGCTQNVEFTVPNYDNVRECVLISNIDKDDSENWIIREDLTQKFRKNYNNSAKKAVIPLTNNEYRNKYYAIRIKDADENYMYSNPFYLNNEGVYKMEKDEDDVEFVIKEVNEEKTGISSGYIVGIVFLGLIGLALLMIAIRLLFLRV